MNKGTVRSTFMVMFCSAAIVAVAGAAVSAAGSVKIDSTNFPDKNFREYVSQTFDIDKDDTLSDAEIKKVTSIDCSVRSIADLKGIEFFPYLTSLTCKDNGDLRRMDVSRNTALKTLICSYTELTELDLTKNTALQKLDVSRCHLDELELTKNTGLTYLNCAHNRLRELDLTKNTKLKYLDYSGNSGYLDSYNTFHLNPDLSKNVLLEELHFDNIAVSYSDYEKFPIDLTNNKKIKVLTCYYSCASELKISGLKDLTELNCSSNKLETLDLTEFTKLKDLNIDSNEITELNLEKNTALTDLSCRSCDLKTLDLTNNKKLKLVICEDNELTNINVTGLTLLDTLNCSENKLESLDLSTNTALTELECSFNSLKSLDLANHKKLKRLETGANGTLTSLKVTGDSALEYLGCRECKIKSLDLKDLTSLTTVDCVINEITTLDVSGCKALTQLFCYDNKISRLTLTGCASLNNLQAYYNSFTSLYINDSPDLLKAYWGDKNEQEYDDGDKHYHYYIYSWYGEFGTSDYGKNVLMYLDTKVKFKDALPSPTPTPTPLPTATPTPKVVGRYSLSRPSVLACGKEGGASVTFYPSAKSVKWKSSDENTASVDNNGLIKAKKAGTVTITITADDGRVVNFVLPILYKDVTNDKDFWYEPTNYLTAKKVVRGYDKQTNFKPANNCTRAQMVTFIWRLMGEPAPKAKTCKFTDVKKTDYFCKACMWGNENHIVEGYKDGTFGPQIVCARRHAVTFLWRLAGQPKPSGDKNKFSDVKKGDYFYTATIWASENKILAGYDDGTFRPDGDCLRRQMVTFLYKYDKFINNK